MSFTANNSGGEYAHKLTVDEIPSHHHQWRGYLANKNAGSSGSYVVPIYGKDIPTEMSITDTGGNLKHNNIQPYIVVYFWRRTA